MGTAFGVLFLSMNIGMAVIIFMRERLEWAAAAAGAAGVAGAKPRPPADSPTAAAFQRKKKEVGGEAVWPQAKRTFSCALFVLCGETLTEHRGPLENDRTARGQNAAGKQRGGGFPAVERAKEAWEAHRLRSPGGEVCVL